MAGDTMVGRLVDLTGMARLSDTTITIVARLIDDPSSPISVVSTALTSSDGTFVTRRPTGRFADASLIMENGSRRLPLVLDLDGSFPEEIVVFLDGRRSLPFLS